MNPLVTLLTQLALFLLVITSIGCATSPAALDRYPRRQIDRPYTLPKGVAQYQPTAGFEYSQDSSNTHNFWTFNPLEFDQSLSDDWNLVWDPLPLGVLHQLVKTDADIWGAGVLIGFDFGSSTGFRLIPNLFSTYRHLFDTPTRWLAAELRGRFTPQIPFKSGTSFDWQTGADLGPFFQITDTLAVAPRVGLFVEKDYYSDFSGNLSFSTGNVRVTMPLSLWLSWSLCKRWDLVPEYTYRHVGYENNFSSHEGTLTANYRW